MSHATNPSTANEIDVRDLVPALRHEKSFLLIDELAMGASAVFANDHHLKSP